MKTYSIALTTDSPFDDDFFELIEKSAQELGLSTYLLYPFNLDETISGIMNKV